MSELIQALQDIIEARRAHDEAFKEYGGYSWGYVGHTLIENIKKAEDKFELCLERFVDNRIAVANDPHGW